MWNSITKQDQRTYWWGAIIIYMVLIYATLPVAPNIWDSVDAACKGNCELGMYIIYFFAAVSVFFYLAYVKKEMFLITYLYWIVFVVILFLFSRLVDRPAEKFHIAEYSLLGVLLYNALKLDFDRYDKKLYIIGSLICVAAGFIDEIIQLVLPNRFFGWNDVILNAASGVIALAMIRFVILKRS